MAAILNGQMGVYGYTKGWRDRVVEWNQACAMTPAHNVHQQIHTYVHTYIHSSTTQSVDYMPVRMLAQACPNYASACGALLGPLLDTMS